MFFNAKNAASNRVHPINILDVGCGWGNFLEIAKKNNIPGRGIDISAESIKICLAKKLNCQKITIEELVNKEKNKYTVLTGFQMIEHLTNPLAFLKAAYFLLKPDGLLLLTTPNNDSPVRKLLGNRWSVYNTDSHFVFYNELMLKKALALTGFKNINIQIDTLRFMSLHYVINRFAQMYIPDFKL